MSRYVLLLAYEPWDFASAGPEVRDYYFAAHRAFEAYVDAHGRRLSGAALGDTDTATTVRRDVADAVTITDGPFAETTEMIGGYYDVELPDLDSALAAAKLLPRAYAVEVRPVVGVEGYDAS